VASLQSGISSEGQKYHFGLKITDLSAMLIIYLLLGLRVGYLVCFQVNAVMKMEGAINSQY